MSEHDDGGPAFPEPVAVSPTGDVYRAYGGMTLRDYFAAQAMAAIISKLPLKGWAVDDAVVEHDPSPLIDIHRIQSSIAAGAYGYADAMLNAREVWK